MKAVISVEFINHTHMLIGEYTHAIDAKKRLSLPSKWRRELGTKVVLAGIHDRVEIWDEKRWTEYKRRIEGQADQLAEKLGEVGVL